MEWYEIVGMIGVPSLLGVIVGWGLNALSNRRKEFEFYAPFGSDEDCWKIMKGNGGRGKKLLARFNIHNPNQHPLTLRDLFCRKIGSKKPFGRESARDSNTGIGISGAQIIGGWEIQRVEFVFFTENIPEIQDVSWDEIEFGYIDLKGNEKLIPKTIYPSKIKPR